MGWGADPVHELLDTELRETMEAAIDKLPAKYRALVEPACGAALASVYDRAEPLTSLAPIIVIVCGGAGVSLTLLDEWRKKILP